MFLCSICKLKKKTITAAKKANDAPSRQRNTEDVEKERERKIKTEVKRRKASKTDTKSKSHKLCHIQRMLNVNGAAGDDRARRRP